MLAEYLTLVRPMEIFLSQKFNCKGADDLKEFLWADYSKGHWDGEFLSDLLKLATSEHKMHPLGFRDYRQVAGAFMEKHLKYKVKDIRGLNAIFDLQGGHTSITAAAEYAVSTEDHGQVSREAMHQYFLASSAWHELLLSSDIEKGQKHGLIISEDSEMSGTVDIGQRVYDNANDIASSQAIPVDVNQTSRMQDVRVQDKRGTSTLFRHNM